MAAELLGGSAITPMDAFKQASQLYRHIFYHMFRHEITSCHDRAEALAQLWFSIDKFLQQVVPSIILALAAAASQCRVCPDVFTW